MRSFRQRKQTQAEKAMIVAKTVASGKRTRIRKLKQEAAEKAAVHALGKRFSPKELTLLGECLPLIETSETAHVKITPLLSKYGVSMGELEQAFAARMANVQAAMIQKYPAWMKKR